MLSKTPPNDYESKFVITEDDVWFAPLKGPDDSQTRSIDIISRALDLENEEVVRKLDEGLMNGKTIVGTYNPFTREVFTSGGTDTTPYIKRRVREVFGGERVEL